MESLSQKEFKSLDKLENEYYSVIDILLKFNNSDLDKQSYHYVYLGEEV